MNPRCKVCRKPLGHGIPKTHSRRARANLLADLLSDPYCSATCARLDNGCALKPAVTVSSPP